MATRVNPDCKLEDQGIEGLGRVYYNLLEPALMTEAVARKEGQMGLGGTFLVSTGAHTGRSPKDKFVVRTPEVEHSIWWENNKPMSSEAFDRLYADMLDHMKCRDYFVQDLFGGADAEAASSDASSVTSTSSRKSDPTVAASGCTRLPNASP